MSRDICLLTDDDTQVERREFLQLLAEKQGFACIARKSEKRFLLCQEGYLSGADFIYSWNDAKLSQLIHDAITSGTGDPEKELGTTFSACQIVVFKHKAKFLKEELKEMEELMGKEYVACQLKGKIQYEVGGWLGNWRSMLILQYETAQVLAHLRGGLLMDTGSLKEVIVPRGGWSPAVSEFMPDIAKKKQGQKPKR